jgi:alpha-glucosidase
MTPQSEQDTVAPVAAQNSAPTTTGSEWWRTAVIYQIYPRSFADASGDGVGDFAGITSRLPALAELDIDAVWFSPFYTSPQKDGGYDVADYCDIDPLFGTLEDFDRMLAKAHELGLRVIVDLVPNHSSDQHEWFQAALAAGPDSEERARYMFREGLGENGELPPNNWQSVFGGPAWTRVTEADGASASGTCTSSTHRSPTSTGRTAGCATSSSTYCASGLTAVLMDSVSTSPTA